MSTIPKEDVIRLCNALHDFTEVVKKAAAPAPAKTRGQEMAEKLLRPDRDNPMIGAAVWPPQGHAQYGRVVVVLNTQERSETAIVSAREFIAAAIDRAIAEEREACAVAATFNATRCDAHLHPEYGRGRSDALRDAIEGIRNRK